MKRKIKKGGEAEEWVFSSPLVLGPGGCAIPPNTNPGARWADIWPPTNYIPTTFSLRGNFRPNKKAGGGIPFTK